MKNSVKILKILSGIHTYKHASATGEYIFTKIYVEFKNIGQPFERYETYCIYNNKYPDSLYFVHPLHVKFIEDHYTWVSHDRKNSVLMKRKFKKILNRRIILDEKHLTDVFYKIKL